MATTSPFAPLADAQDYLFDRADALPDAFRNKLREIVRPGNLPLPLAMRDAGELIYAWRDQLPEDMKAIGVQVFRSLIAYQQFGYQTERGPALCELLAGGELEEGQAVPTPTYDLTPAGLEAREAANQPAADPLPESYAPDPR